MTPEQEQETLRLARELFADWRRDEGDVSDVDVRLEGEPGRSSIVVTFAHRDRPGCRFGYTRELYDVDEDDADENDPEWQVTLLWANLTEDVGAVGYGLPTNCRPGEIVWLGRRRLLLELDLAIGHVLDEYAGRFEGNDVKLRDALVEAVDSIVRQHMRDYRKRLAAWSKRRADGPDMPPPEPL